MNGAGHIARPEIEIPAGPNMERVPAGSDQGRRAVVVILEDELPAMQRDMSVGFGVGRLLGGVEGELFVRDKFGDAFLDHDAVTENALTIRTDKVAAIGGL